MERHAFTAAREDAERDLAATAVAGSRAPLRRAQAFSRDQPACVLEPIVELYDRSSLFDVLAIKYHERRNYLHGWLTRLRELAALGRAEILQVRRLGFGDRYHEAYSVILWKPL